MSQYYDFDQGGDVLQQLFNKIAALDNATTEEAGLMSASDKEKLDGIESGAEENAIATIQIGGTALTPDNKVVNIETDSEPTFGSVKLVLSGPLYTKFLSYYTKAEVDQLVAAIHQFVPVVADSLPEASADTMYLLYLIPSTNPKTRNAKDEFITIRTGEEGSYTYSWEQIGTTTIDIDGKEDKSNKVTSFSNPTDRQYPSAKLVSDSLDKVKADVNSLLTKAGIAEGIADTISAGTAQEFLQRQSGGDGVNCIKRIKGCTKAINQLINVSATSQTTQGITVTVSDSKIKISGTATSQTDIYITVPNISLIAGHKYMLTPDIGNVNYGLFISGSLTNYKGVFTPSGNETNRALIRRIANGASVDEEFSYPELVDLTLAGFADYTLAQILALYPNGFGAYNAGVLKSNDAAALLTDGRNQWDEEWLSGTYSTSNGETYTAQSGYLCSKNKIPVFAGQAYYVKAPATFRFFLYDKNGVFFLTETRAGGSTIEIPSNAGFMRFQLAYSGSYANNICINFSDASFNGTYEPYWTRKVNFGLDAIKVKSPNIWDEVVELGTLNTTTGEESSSSTQIRAANFIPIKPNTTYYCHCGAPSVALWAILYDADFNVIDGTTWPSQLSVRSNNARSIENQTFTTAANAAFIRFYLIAAYGTTYNNDICINLSAIGINGKYFPYGEDGILTYNGLDGAGTAFDFIFKDANGIQKLQKTMLTEIDLGDLTWTKVAAQAGYLDTFQSSEISNIKMVPRNTVGNSICSAYVTRPTTYNDTNNQDKVCFIYTVTPTIVVCDTSKNTLTTAQFKAAMAGVKLIAEAATPAILELAEPIPDTILVDNYGTERIQAPEGATAPSAPFCCDSNYSISIANLVKKLNSNE